MNSSKKGQLTSSSVLQSLGFHSLVIEYFSKTKAKVNGKKTMKKTSVDLLPDNTNCKVSSFFKWLLLKSPFCNMLGSFGTSANYSRNFFLLTKSDQGYNDQAGEIPPGHKSWL